VRPLLLRVAALSLLIACSDEQPMRPTTGDWRLEPIRASSALRLSARLIPDTSEASSWFVQLMARNTVDAPDTITYGPCSFGAVLHDSRDRTTAVWDNAPRPGTACADVLYVLEVPPLGLAGASVTRIPAGLPLPAGTYWAGLAFRIGGQTFMVTADSVVI
jgi:hypothetical protein